MVVTIEETRTREIEVDAESFEEAVEIVTEEYTSGGIYMDGGMRVCAMVGDDENDFEEIAVWYG